MKLLTWTMSQHLLNVRVLHFFLLFLPMMAFAEKIPFQDLMGKGSSVWESVQTAEDRAKLNFFEESYNQWIESIEVDHAPKVAKIPKIFHFIWLGPKEFPEASIAKIEKWIELHPDWKVYFWTDIHREAPLEKMESHFVEDFSFQLLSDAYYQSDNFGEKAKILCYEILYQMGGVYVDHDVKPCTLFDPLNEGLDFYCGLERLGPSILSSSVYAATHLIASKSGHPILYETLLWLSQMWKKMEDAYPGHSKSALKNRFMHRTLWALNEGIERGMKAEGNRNLIFPSSYFSLARREASSMALHAHEESWTTEENDFETRMCGQFQEIVVKNNESLKIVLLLSLGVILSVIILFSFARTMRRTYES